MTVIRYSLGKLLGIAAFTGAFAGLWLWMLLAPKTFMFVHGRYGWLIHLIAENAWLSGGLFAACFGVTAVILMTAFGDRTALALRPEGIEARTMLGRQQAAWDRVGGIALEQKGPLGKGGETLNVRLRQETGEKVMKLSVKLLEQSRWEIGRLLDATGRPGVHGVDGPPVRASGAGAEPGPELAPSMDYDAVIARHLAAREQAGTAPAAQPATPAFPQPTGFPQPARGGFGRKGL
jgi:hypothetical protein